MLIKLSTLARDLNLHKNTLYYSREITAELMKHYTYQKMVVEIK